MDSALDMLVSRQGPKGEFGVPYVVCVSCALEPGTICIHQFLARPLICVRGSAI